MFCFFVVVVFLGVFFILSFWPVKSGLHQRSYERLLKSVFVKLLVFVYVLVIIEILQNSYWKFIMSKYNTTTETKENCKHEWIMVDLVSFSYLLFCMKNCPMIENFDWPANLFRKIIFHMNEKCRFFPLDTVVLLLRLLSKCRFFQISITSAIFVFFVSKAIFQSNLWLAEKRNQVAKEHYPRKIV